MFDRYISLGLDCEPVVQLRRLTGVSQASVLDWQLLTHKALVGVLANDFDGYFELPNLVLGEDRRHVLDTATGLEFHHLFTIDLDGTIAAHRVARDYPRLRARQDYLLRRWRETVSSDRPVLYVRRDPNDEFTAEELTELRDVLRTSYPAHRFALVWVRPEISETNVDEMVRISDGVYATQMAVQQPRAEHWRGDDRAWDRLFARLGSLEPITR